MRFVGVLVMASGLHEDAHAGVCRFAIGRDVDDVLEDHVVEQVTLNRAVMAVGEDLAESAAVEAPRAFLAAEDPSQEVDLAIVGIQVDRFVIEALVQVVAVFELEIADGLRILELGDMRGELFDLLFERAELFVGGHGDPFWFDGGAGKRRQRDYTVKLCCFMPSDG